MEPDDSSKQCTRITVFHSGSTNSGKVISTLPESFPELLNIISSKLNIDVSHLHNSQGGSVEDLRAIRDNDVLYASSHQSVCGAQVYHALPGSTETLPGSDTLEGLSSTSGCNPSEWITLNVGGKVFTTTRGTLTRFDGDSMLARMFCKDKDIGWSSRVDGTGAYLIDRSPLYFEPILNYLRHGKLILDKNVNPEGVLEEAKFFGLTSLIETLEEIIDREQQPDDNTPITRRDLVLRLLSTPTNQELRCQGMNFTGANLSKLDLRFINFKYAILRRANLSGANLSFCNFERADLGKAVVDSANLLGVKMLCANLEGTSMRGCYFEDPAGSRANMEGALMKNVDLEGSHMAGVNLRVATLKNANLQNCDLRGAVLAGADLENCDLTGCDLQEANLRGANLKGATFELMLHPLHMAQAVR
ncbi:BTB/POZ domain-containing protein kctd9-like [Plakobranchus ocellatus]|uniref:BTB/POZ domain-containing protein kctd9-like n=1 Tax=Plakobranchus ocellatus TaxID=259542 RepID=A0AAV4CUZ1_9GAST|nr:BTB/POZ domain-containing protein kctd9-like [Plakobranchus ocellatus]